MNQLLDIAFTLGLLVFLIVGAAVTAKTVKSASSLLSWFRRPGSVSTGATQRAGAETRPFRGILVYHDETA